MTYDPNRAEAERIDRDERALDEPLMAEDPQFRSMGWTREQELDYLRAMEDQSALHEACAYNGVAEWPCAHCGEYALTERTVTTLGYRGHPGEERSTLYECINCEHSAL